MWDGGVVDGGKQGVAVNSPVNRNMTHLFLRP